MLFSYINIMLFKPIHSTILSFLPFPSFAGSPTKQFPLNNIIIIDVILGLDSTLVKMCYLYFVLFFSHLKRSPAVIVMFTI
jgi:hypothetical protein